MDCFEKFYNSNNDIILIYYFTEHVNIQSIISIEFFVQKNRISKAI